MDFHHNGEPERLPIIFNPQEWADIAHMTEHYRMCTDWSENGSKDDRALAVGDFGADMKRRRKLAERIKNAS